MICLLGGCTSLYYKAQEKLGNEKRDILIDRVKKGRKEQEQGRNNWARYRMPDRMRGRAGPRRWGDCWT